MLTGKVARECRIGWKLFVLVVLAGCAETPATRLVPVTEGDAPVRWIGPENVPILRDTEQASGGFAALGAVLSFWGHPIGVHSANTRAHEVVLAGDLECSARAAGLSTVSFHGTLEDLLFELKSGRPVIVAVAQDGATSPAPHYEVVVGWDPVGLRLRTMDPARGFVERTFARFLDEWAEARQLTLVVYDSEPTTGTTSSSD